MKNKKVLQIMLILGIFLALSGVGMGYSFAESPTVDSLPGPSKVNLTISNHDSTKYAKNNQYEFFMSGSGGLGATKIRSDNVSTEVGEYIKTTNQSGTFYVSFTGGDYSRDTVLLMLAVNGTISKDFKITLTSNGYRWDNSGHPSVLLDDSYYKTGISHTFTYSDFKYNSTWKPAYDSNYSIAQGQDHADLSNMFYIMFIDLDVGAVNTNGLIDNGRVKIDYMIENLGFDSSAVFNIYGFKESANVAWTNNIAQTGYVVYNNVIYVDPVSGNDANDGSINAPKLSIKGAIDSSSAGSIIFLKSGIYKGENNTGITIAHDLTIIGENKDTTIIDGEYLKGIFTITGGSVVNIEAITFKRGNYSFSSAIGGGAIFLNYSTLNINNCIFTDNRNTIQNSPGGAIHSAYGNLTIKNSIFEKNRGARNGGAISLNYGTLSVINSTFIGNIVGDNAVQGAASGGAAISNSRAIITIEGSIFINHGLEGSIPGSVISNGDSSIQSCIFIGNVVDLGVIYNNNAINNFMLEYCIFINNTIDFWWVNPSTSSGSSISNNLWSDITGPTVANIAKDNYFIIEILNKTSSVTGPYANFEYILRLNTGESFDPSLLPFFEITLSTNGSSVPFTFDGRYSNHDLGIEILDRDQNINFLFNLIVFDLVDLNIEEIELYVGIESPTTLTLNAVSGKQGETVTIIASLSLNGIPIENKLVNFYLNGVLLGSIIQIQLELQNSYIQLIE